MAMQVEAHGDCGPKQVEENTMGKDTSDKLMEIYAYLTWEKIPLNSVKTNQQKHSNQLLSS